MYYRLDPGTQINNSKILPISRKRAHHVFARIRAHQVKPRKRGGGGGGEGGLLSKLGRVYGLANDPISAGGLLGSCCQKQGGGEGDLRTK